MMFAFVILGCLVSTTAAATTDSYTACGDTSYYGPSGVISSPNYTGNYDNYMYCDYYIYASTGSSLSIIFKSFNTEQNYDIVTISCPTNSSFPPRQFSGYSLPLPVSIPWCSRVLVNFRTDYSISSTRFSLDYYVSDGGCGNTVYSDSFGYVTSPNYPNYYGYNQNCSNIIWAPQQSQISLYFHQFELEDDCSSDWMEVSLPDNTEYGPYRYCGTRTGLNLYIYQCSQALLWFHSDGSNNYQGFNIQYSISPDPDDRKVPINAMPNAEENAPSRPNGKPNAEERRKGK